jgi:hypothetical protein
MTKDRIPSSTGLTGLTWAAMLCLSNPALSAEPVATPQVSKTSAKATPATDSTAKPANARRATTGPGTQTEDDIYVGAKKKTKVLSKAKAATGGNDDLDELEVERRSVKKK